jgi:hypothetical protein
MWVWAVWPTKLCFCLPFVIKSCLVVENVKQDDKNYSDFWALFKKIRPY